MVPLGHRELLVLAGATHVAVVDGIAPPLEAVGVVVIRLLGGIVGRLSVRALINDGGCSRQYYQSR
ncbi:MAG: hypothetical protein UT86_C0004G0115 [Candidatus Magasanikbacteria bacterium GW2011_GWC2_40_17]|uniref:Uncharacterized protein n=1 Tax=Candidatus Magasanikbacteria bacterium GW2011_GWA2_42_32 TaxID=1619039 RepID=A0A0G1D579_9BACT|nr:MAG: hypothetical protein UT86_C0004G0115 [Candidatus Magasanikbacteria bacterium GW2011_GWC2_40_17]KKS57173.1 MAG: hypothetical protein UV20_C0003G0115 [Candidatus Magasanikbacteria bacterium GW2011_GWA2_42_32]